MADNHFSFTANRLAAIPAPVRGATYVYDMTMPGLAMRVTAGGARTFVLYRRLNGRPTRVNLGAVNAMSVVDARKAVQQISGQVAAGVDVVAERRALRVRGRSVGDAFTAWIGMAKHRKRTWDDDRRLWEIWIDGKPSQANIAGETDSEHRRQHIAFPSFARRTLSEVTTGEVENITRRIGAKNPRTANKLRALLSTVWNHAIRRGEASVNPVRFVERFPEHSRERYLKEAELESFLLAVAVEPPTWRDYFLIALLTGQRRENISRMRWDEIDFDSSVWHIPAAKTKNKRATAVPLTELAAGLLSRRQKEVTGEWVFPSYVGSLDGCVREPRKPWKRVLKRAGLSDLRVHDLRRSVGSWLGASGTNSYTIARALGHLSVRSGEVYVRLAADPIRDAMHRIQMERPLLSAAVSAATQTVSLGGNQTNAAESKSETC